MQGLPWQVDGMNDCAPEVCCVCTVAIGMDRCWMSLMSVTFVPIPTPACPQLFQTEFYKTIANLHYVLPTLSGMWGPHVFNMRENATTVNSRGVRVERSQSQHVVKDEIFLHHYATRSAEEYAAKVKRGGGIHKTGRHHVPQLAVRDSRATLDCLDAVRHVQRVTSSLRNSRSTGSS